MHTPHSAQQHLYVQRVDCPQSLPLQCQGDHIHISTIADRAMIVRSCMHRPMTPASIGIKALISSLCITPEGQVCFKTSARH